MSQKIRAVCHDFLIFLSALLLKFELIEINTNRFCACGHNQKFVVLTFSFPNPYCFFTVPMSTPYFSAVSMDLLLLIPSPTFHFREMINTQLKKL
jgi:hypothetical protein